MKKKLLAVLLTLTTVISLGACGNQKINETKSTETIQSTGSTKSLQSTESTQEAGGELTTLRIALPTWVGYGPLYVALEKGFFEENGVNVELSIVEGLAERKQALISGNLEGLATAVDVFVNLEGAGINMDMVWLLDRSDGADGIVATSDVTTPADLKGKTIATEVGTTEHLFLLKVLEQYGLTQADITLTPMTIGDAGTAFVAGKVDAAVTYDPYLAQGIAAGGTGFTTADYEIDLMDAVGFTDAVIEAEPDAVQGFVNAVAEATAYIADNREECVSIMAKGLKLDESDVSATIDKLECFTLEGNISQVGESDEQKGKLYDSVKDIAVFYMEQGLNDTEIDPASIINPDFIRNAK